MMNKRGKIGVIAASSMLGIFFCLSTWAQEVEDDEVIQECALPPELERNFILRINKDTSMDVGQSAHDAEEIRRAAEAYELAFYRTKFDKEIKIGEMEVEVKYVKTAWYPYRMSVEFRDQDYLLNPAGWFKSGDSFYYLYRPVGQCEVEVDDDDD